MKPRIGDMTVDGYCIDDVKEYLGRTSVKMSGKDLLIMDWDEKNPIQIVSREMVE